MAIIRIKANKGEIALVLKAMWKTELYAFNIEIGGLTKMKDLLS